MPYWHGNSWLEIACIDFIVGLSKLLYSFTPYSFNS